ncbi:ribosome maturation factor RimM [Nitrincola tibetensis]|uniref:Ribosome maturation factor RimM n=1 Tax=Nitrincola tibetensis TaxID=2219697 RepID=A0A364NMN5_9GAMM|nr:ribosome maturation factor RimM [Nitrincola tibetensis]RAU18359.1 ribosome maturation factor RimM [Nitrincola tibetensis]
MQGESTDKRVVIARFSAPYGVKGWVKIYSYTDPIENVFTYTPWQVNHGGQWKALKLESFKPHGKGLIAKLAGVDTPEEVRAFVGAEISVFASQMPDLEDGEYYWSQLENLLVYTESGVLLGRVDHLIETGSNDVLVVKATKESIDDAERLIPYLPDQVITKINLESGELRVNWDPEF